MSDADTDDGEMNDRDVGEPPDQVRNVAGMDLVRRALEEARGAARNQGKHVGQGRRSPTGHRPVNPANSRRRWSGPGPDARDPQLLGSVAHEVADARGWNSNVAAGTVFGRWRAVVGEHIADHATPTSLRDGVLSVAAESTAWATQLRMVQSQLLAKIAAVVGNGVVTQLRITGPTAPSWRKGPRNVPGRGPRDTYG